MSVNQAGLAGLMVCLLLGLGTEVLAAMPRTALIIGNSAYTEARLRNPVNDAVDMAEELQDLGFEVILKTDIDQRQFEKVLRTFKQRLQRRGGVGLFFYAGHGMQPA